jgi:hypothetical protein
MYILNPALICCLRSYCSFSPILWKPRRKFVCTQLPCWFRTQGFSMIVTCEVSWNLNQWFILSNTILLDMPDAQKCILSQQLRIILCSCYIWFLISYWSHLSLLPSTKPLGIGTTAWSLNVLILAIVKEQACKFTTVYHWTSILRHNLQLDTQDEVV